MDETGKDEGRELADEQLEGVAGGFVIELPEDDGGSSNNNNGTQGGGSGNGN